MEHDIRPLNTYREIIDAIECLRATLHVCRGQWTLGQICYHYFA